MAKRFAMPYNSTAYKGTHPAYRSGNRDDVVFPPPQIVPVSAQFRVEPLKRSFGERSFPRYRTVQIHKSWVFHRPNNQLKQSLLMKSIRIPSLATLRAIGVLTAIIILSLVLNAAQCLAQAVVGDPPKAAKSDSAKKEKLEFMRVRKERGKPVAMETAIVKYVATEGPYAGAQVDLIGAVHIAEQSYFDELNVRFKDYEAVLYELVANPEDRPKPTDEPRRSAHPVGMLQLGMKDMLGLTFQLEKIDYEAKNFVHADMNPEEMSASMAERGDGFMALLFRSMGAGMAMQGAGQSSDADLLAALFSRDRPKALRRAFAQQFEMMELQMAGLAGEDGKSTLITERNAKAMDVLKRELAAGKKKISIFYGAGHLSDMHARLINDFQMKPEGTQWIEAWDLR